MTGMLPVQDAVTHLVEVARDGDAATGAATYPAELPVLAGHFPGNPVVPGVHVVGLVLALVRAALGQPDLAIAAIGRVKWPRVSLPGDRLEVAVKWRETDDGLQVDGTVANGGEVACKVRLTCR